MLRCRDVRYHSQLKTIEDARRIRNKVLSNLELASLPTTTPEERQKLLSFVVCGGGPTGVEFASELYDMINEDVLDYVSITILTKPFLLDLRAILTPLTVLSL